MTSACVWLSTWLCMVSMSSMCTCDCIWDGHEDGAFCQAALDILSILLEDAGQRIPGQSPHPPPGPRPGPCFPTCTFWKKAKPKASPEQEA